MSDEPEADGEFKFTTQDYLVNYGYGIGGAVVGAIAAFYLFQYLTKQGIYAPILPGAVVGLGCAVVTWGRSILMGLICSNVAIPAHLYSEYKTRLNKNGKPFNDFMDFLSQLLDGNNNMTITFICVGLACAFFIGKSGWRPPGENIGANASSRRGVWSPRSKD